jgi:transcription initiation factor TFIIE subunit alpha
VKKDKIIQAYLLNLVGEPGVAMIEQLSTDELTDKEIATETSLDLNTVRRTLFTLYEHRLASYVQKRDKESGWMLYRWHIDLSDIQHHLESDAQKLIDELETWLTNEQINVYYTCENSCGRYTFEMASGYECGYEFICPVCKTSLHHQDNSNSIDAVQRKINELKVNLQAIFYPENLRILDSAVNETSKSRSGYASYQPS